MCHDPVESDRPHRLEVGQDRIWWPPEVVVSPDSTETATFDEAESEWQLKFEASEMKSKSPERPSVTIQDLSSCKVSAEIQSMET